MRGSKAKAIRSLALKATVGQPWARWGWLQDTCMRKVTNPKHEQFGEVIPVKIARIVLDPKCGKGVYRKLKKELGRRNLILRRRRDRERIRADDNRG